MKKGIIGLIILYFGLIQGAEGKQPTQPNEQIQQTSQPPLEQLEISWSDIETMSKQLSEILKGTQWAGILAITRGGLFPAGFLSESLNIRRIETINIHSYNSKKSQGKVNLLNAPYIPNYGKNWLIVDDLVDSGKTMTAVRKLYPKAVCVTLYAKPEGLPTVDHHVRLVDQKLWIVFPWEKYAPEEE